MDDDPNTDWRAVTSRPLDLDFFHPLSSVTALEIEALSICGAERAHNTDHYLAIRLGRTQETLLSSLAAADLPPHFEEYAYALLVADGLGDGGAGARASRVALSALAHLAIRYGHWNVRVDAQTVATIMEHGAFLWRRTHDAVVKASRGDVQLAEMTTSLTAVYVAGADLFFAHTGHSKAFIFRDGTLVQLTCDGTTDQRVGGHADPEVEFEHVTLADGDRLLLCTNGLTDAVTEDAIAGVLALARRPADDCQRLADLAAGAHAPDDVTVMVADYRLHA